MFTSRMYALVYLLPMSESRSSSLSAQFLTQNTSIHDVKMISNSSKMIWSKTITVCTIMDTQIQNWSTTKLIILHVHCSNSKKFILCRQLYVVFYINSLGCSVHNSVYSILRSFFDVYLYINTTISDVPLG